MKIAFVTMASHRFYLKMKTTNGTDECNIFMWILVIYVARHDYLIAIRINALCYISYSFLYQKQNLEQKKHYIILIATIKTSYKRVNGFHDQLYMFTYG